MRTQQEEPTTSRRFDHIVSLGYDCRVAYHLRRFYSTDEAHVFDWWGTTGDGLIQLIENDFEGVFAASDLKIACDGYHVLNQRYASYHSHDFAKTDDGKMIEITSEAITQAQSKADYLHQRWNGLADAGTVLFVRYEWYPTESVLIQWEPAKLTPQRLLQALDKKFPTLDFKLVLVDCPPLDNPRVVHRKIKDFMLPGETQVLGTLSHPQNDAIWDRLLTSLNIAEPMAQARTEETKSIATSNR